MPNAPLAHVFRRLVNRVATPTVRSRRTVLEVTQNTLESRLAPAALAAPTVDSTTLQWVRVSPPATVVQDFINSQLAINPENPQQQVIVAEHVYSNGFSTIAMKGSFDGGVTWTDIDDFGKATLRDPSQKASAGDDAFFRQWDNPSVTMTRDGQVYVAFVATNAAGSNGIVGVRRYDLATLAPVSMNKFTGDGLTREVFRWADGKAGAFNPVILANPNVQTYTDPDTNLVMNDPAAGTAAGGGQVYVGYTLNAVQAIDPDAFGATFQPGVVQVAATTNIPAATAKAAGQYFSAPVIAGGSYGVNPTLTGAATRARLAITGNNSVGLDLNGKQVQSPGQLVTVWENTGTQNKTIGMDATRTGQVVTIGGTTTAVQTITDALPTPMGGTFNISQTTPDYLIPVTGTVPAGTGGFKLSNISVSLGLTHAALSDVGIDLYAPDGTTKYRLVRPRNKADATDAEVAEGDGVIPGLTGADLGIQNGVVAGTTFTDYATRRINDPDAAPYVGQFRPDKAGTTAGLNDKAGGNTMRVTFSGLNLAAGSALGDWKIVITDTRNQTPATPQSIRFGSIQLNFAPLDKAGNTDTVTGLRQGNFDSSPNNAITADGGLVVTPNGLQNVLALQGSLTPIGYTSPLATTIPTNAGPGVAAVVDNSLGANASATNPSPIGGVFSGRLYIAQTAAVDLDNSGTLTAGDDLDVFLSSFDTTTLNPFTGFFNTAIGLNRVNDDRAADNFSQGLRYQYNPALAVDPRTGTLGVAFLDARYDAANARYVPMLTTSLDGGATFSPQVSLAQQRVATDVISGRELTVEPLPTNLGKTTADGNTSSLGNNPLAIGINNGRVTAAFAGNPNAPGGYVYTARGRTAAGPQVVYSDMGAIGAVVTTDAGGNSVVQASAVQLDNPIAPLPPRFFRYNATRQAGPGVTGATTTAALPAGYTGPGVAAGTALLDGIRVVFDRRIDPTTFNPDDVRVFFQGTAGGSPVELRTLYPTLAYRIVNLSALTQGVLANGGGLGALDTSPGGVVRNIVTDDTDYVILFVDNTDTTPGADEFTQRRLPVGLVGTYSYALTPYIRDFYRNTFAGLAAGGLQIYPATTANGKIVDPVTVSAFNPTTPIRVDIESRRYDNESGAPGPFISKVAQLTSLNGVAAGAAAAADGVTDVPVDFPALPAGQDLIARLLVQIDLVHTRRSPTSNLEGLIVQLISPTGAVVPLTVFDGGNGTEYDGFAYENTVFDPLAALPLSAGSGRYRGTFRPFGDLSQFNGLSPTGTWYLRIIDNDNTDNQYGETKAAVVGPPPVAGYPGNPLGYLRNWSLTVVPGQLAPVGFGTTADSKQNNLRRGNLLDIDGDGSSWEPVEDSYRAPRSVAPLTLTGGPYQVGGKNLFEQGAFDKATLPLVVAGPRVLGVSTASATGRNLNDQVYVNRPADLLFVKFDRAVTVPANANGIRVTGPAGLVAGPFTVAAGATPDELVIGFAGSAGGAFTRGGSYTVQFDASIASAVGDAVDVNLNAGVDRLFGGNAATAPIQSMSFNNSGGPVTIRSAPVAAVAGGQFPTGESVAEIPIPVSQAFLLAQDLARFPNARLKLDLQIRDNDPNAATPLFSGLTADLVAPDGTRIRLFTSNLNSQSGPGSVTTRITFDDAALAPAGGGINPFQTAPYNPQQPLSRLLGKWSYGTWKVVVTNTLFRLDPNTLLAVDLGQILSASLTLTNAAVNSGLGEARSDETTVGFRVYNQDPTSKESSQVWQAVGASPSNGQANVGRVSAVTIDTADPTGNTVFAAGASGGVWKTTNFLTTDPDGPSWTPLTDFGPSTALNVASIAVFPRNNDPQQTVVFALTGEGNAVNLPDGNTPWTKPGVGVLRSTDGGRTWTLLDSSVNADPTGAVTDISAAGRDRRFVGASGFKIIIDPLPYPRLPSDVGDPATPNLAVYMAVSDARPAADPAFAGGIWRSLDSGRTWTRISGGNATDVAFAPGSVGPDGNTQTLYSALVGPGVVGGVYITRQATNVPATTATSTGALTRLAGGGGNNVIRDQLAGGNVAVGVAGQAGPPGTTGTRITLAVPALTNNPLANNIYQGWMYATASNADGSFGGLYLTKDFGTNWTLVRLPELSDGFGSFWGHNNEAQANGKANFVEYNPTTQLSSNVGYTRSAALSETPRTYIPRPGGGSAFSTTPRANGQGAPSQDGAGGTANRALSLAVDPLNPAVVFIGGDRSVRVDTSVIKDAQSYYYFDNTDASAATLLNTRLTGGVSMPQVPAIQPADGLEATTSPVPWGVITPGLAGQTDTANGLAPVYRDKYGLPAGFVNLSKDPSNPFLNPSVIGVYNAGTFTNTGENASLRPFDNILFGGYDVTSIVPFVDPQTGKTRLIYGTANGIYTGVDTAAPSGASLDIAIGDSPFVANPTQVAGVVFGSRNGNLQIGQYYAGAVQPSRLAADIAGALFYAVSQDNGYPVSTPGVIETGNTAMRTTDWPGTGLSVAADPTGTGNAYQYRLPSSTGTDTSNTAFGNSADFFRLQLPGADQAASGIGRTNNLLIGQNPFANQGNFPLNDTRYGTFAVNNLDGAGLAISAAPSTAGTGGTGQVFRSIDRGFTWQNLGSPAGNAAAYVSALAFGGPDTRFPAQRNNYILAGTGDSTAAGYSVGGTNGQVYFTVNGTIASWVRVPGDTAATGGRSIQRIVPNPRFSSAQAYQANPATASRTDFYVLTDRQVFYVNLFSGTDTNGSPIPLDRDNPAAVQATWTDVTGNLYGLTRPLDSFGTDGKGNPQSVTALRDLTGKQLDLTALAVDWRYTSPVLYVAGDGGVFRNTSGQAAWTAFPDNPAGSYADGGFLPNVRITDLDLSLGVIDQTYDPANPGKGGLPILGLDAATGLPRSGGSLNLLVATTYGRGQFVTRINPADPALNDPNDPVRPDAFVSGPRVRTIANPNPVGGNSSTSLIVVFDAPVDPVTFRDVSGPNADVFLRNKAGDPIAITSITPVPGVPGQPDTRDRYTISFPAQTVAGFYYLQVGNSKDLSISDLAGNRMNQNSNLLNGETFASPNGDDTYSTFVYLNGNANSLLVTGLPSKVSTQAPTTFTVTATKADGSVDTTFAGKVNLASTDDANVLLSSASGPGTAPNSKTASYTFSSTDAGRHAFTVTFRTGAAITDQFGNLLNPAGLINPTDDQLRANLVGLFRTVTVDLDATNPFLATYNPGKVGAAVYNARLDKTAASLPVAISAWDPQTTTAKVVDFNGNVLPAFGGTVTLSSATDANVILPAPFDFEPNVTTGVAPFAGILFRTKGAQDLTYTGDAVDGLDPLTVTSKVSNAVIDVAGLASKLSTFDPQALTVTVRSALTGAALPAFNLSNGPQAKVTVATDDPLATVSPPVISYPIGSGGAGTGEVLFRTKGSPTRQVTFTAPIGVDTLTKTPEVVNAQFRVSNANGTPFAPSKLSTWNPQAVTVDAISPVTNKVLPRFAGDVTVTSTDPLAAAVLPDSDPANKLAPLAPAGQTYTYAAADKGSRVQTVLFRTGNSLATGGLAQSFTFASPVGTDARTVGTKVVNAVFNVQTLPPTVTAGVGVSLSIAIADPLNNNATLPAFVGTVTLGSDDKQATFAPNPFTYTSVNNGNKSFVATFRTSGDKTFTVDTLVGVDKFNGKTTVQADVATLLTLSGTPNPTTASATTNYTAVLTAFDKFGNVATGYNATVALTTTDKQAVLPATVTFDENNGQEVIPVTFKTATTSAQPFQQLVASDQTPGGLSASITNIVVLPNTAAQFLLFGFPSTVVAGDKYDVKLQVSDAFGNRVPTYAGVLNFSSNDGKVSPGNGLPSKDLAVSGGLVTIPGVELRTVGTDRFIQVTDGTLTGKQSPIVVTPAPASTFAFTLTTPADIPAGGTVGFRLVAQDRFGNQDTNYLGTVTFSSSDPNADRPAPYTFNVNNQGQREFTARLLSSGTQTLTATDLLSGAKGTSPAITVQPAAAGLLNVSGFPNPIGAGTSGTFDVTLFDNSGNKATGFTGTIGLTSSDPTAVFALASNPTVAITSYTFTGADSGTQRFVSTLTRAGLQTLSVTPLTDPQVNSGTISTTVQAAAVTGFRVSEFPSPVDAGTSRLVRVTALDRFGNTADNYTGLVRLTSSDPQAVLPPQSKLTGGTAFFLVTLNTAGTQSITASDTLAASVLGSQDGITVNGVLPPPVAKSPVLSDLPAATVTTGGSLVTGFTVTTFPLGSDANGLVYTATSSDPVLVPQSGLVFGGTGGVRTLTVTPAAGRTGSATVTVTLTDPATNLFGTKQLSLTVNPVPPPPPPPPGQTNLFVVGSDIGVLNRVTVYNPDGTVLNRLEPFAAGFSFGTRATTVRQADGKQLVAAVPGAGRQTEVRILDPYTGATVRTLEGFESGFQGGLFVAAGDVNADGYDDIAISPDQGGGGRVKVYDGKTFAQLADFFGIDDPTFRGGARVTFGDLNGDGKSDLMVAAGFGGGPRVALFDGSTIVGGQSPIKFMGDFFVFEQSLRNGVFLTAGDLTGDGKAELIVAGGPGGGPRVFALDGAGLMQGRFDQVANFFAGNPDNRGGVRVTVKDLDGDRLADLVAGDGVGSGTTVRVYYGADIVRAGANGTPAAGIEYEELPGTTNGVFVG